ncbi:hypothetical protein B0H10DRAFT_2193163 [Mycena sp. CBHHK59/15]|nr:hypothetical protein B0H10DRAFT_2193163 [Mycena sp. CBHHK59/15]
MANFEVFCWKYQTRLFEAQLEAQLRAQLPEMKLDVKSCRGVHAGDFWALFFLIVLGFYTCFDGSGVAGDRQHWAAGNRPQYNKLGDVQEEFDRLNADWQNWPSIHASGTSMLETDASSAFSRWSPRRREHVYRYSSGITGKGESLHEQANGLPGLAMPRHQVEKYGLKSHIRTIHPTANLSNYRSYYVLAEGEEIALKTILTTKKHKSSKKAITFKISPEHSTEAALGEFSRVTTNDGTNSMGASRCYEIYSALSLALA